MQKKIINQVIFYTTSELFRLSLILVSAFLTRKLVSDILAETPINELVLWECIVVLILLLYWASFRLTIKVKAKLSNVEQELFLHKLGHIFNNELSNVDSISVESLDRRLSKDMELYSHYKLWILPTVYINLFGAVIYICIIAYLKWIIVVGVVGLSICQIIPPLLVKVKLKKVYNEINDVGEEWMSHILEAEEGLSLIKVESLQSWYMEKLEEINNKNHQAYSYKFKKFSHETMVMNFVNSLLVYGTYLWLGLFVYWNQIELKDLILLMILTSSFYSIMKSLFTSLLDIYDARISIDRVDEICSVEDDNSIDDTNSSMEIANKIQDHEYVMEINDLSHDYMSDQKEVRVFDDAKVRFSKSHIHGIAGDNGTGKTTLINILLKKINPNKGQVKFYNVDYKNIDSTTLYSKIAYSEQNNNLLGDNLYNLARESLNPTELTKFNNLANTFELNEELLHKNLKDLSGGEHRKSILAYQFAKDAEILILDEPTNSLDKASKAKLIQLLKDYKKTLIIVTHDQEILDMCHMVHTIEGGKICS